MNNFRFAMTSMLAVSSIGLCLALSPAAQAADDEKGAMTDANTKMMKDMNMQPSGDADMDFVMMMMPHHQGAIDMANVELKYGKDPVLRAMAKDIIKSQAKEIEEMKKWQKKHGM